MTAGPVSKSCAELKPTDPRLLLRLNHATRRMPEGVTAVRAVRSGVRVSLTIWLDDGYLARSFELGDRLMLELRVRHWLVCILHASGVRDNEEFADRVTADVAEAAYAPT